MSTPHPNDDALPDDSGPRTLERRQSRSAAGGAIGAGVFVVADRVGELMDGPAPAPAAAPLPPAPQPPAPEPQAPASPAPEPPAPEPPAAPEAEHPSGEERRDERPERHDDPPSVPRGAPTPFAEEIDAAAARHHVDPALLRGLIRQESNFDPKATSPAGAKGLCQLMPETARELGVTDPYDPKQSIEGGAKYLGAQLERFGKQRLALAAYNAGPGNVERYGGVPPFPETQEYVERVSAYAREYRDAAPTGDRPPAGGPRPAATAAGDDASGDSGPRSGVYEAPREQHVARASATERPARTGDRIVELAKRELGVREEGDNDGARIAEYREDVAGSAPGQPWCAQFVSSISKHAGRALGDAGEGFSAVSQIWAWGQSHERAVLAGPDVEPRPGDLIVFTNPPFRHVGIVEKVLPTGEIQTIEGNYGNQVARVVHAPGGDIYGYVRMR